MVRKDQRQFYANKKTKQTMSQRDELMKLLSSAAAAAALRKEKPFDGTPATVTGKMLDDLEATAVTNRTFTVFRNVDSLEALFRSKSLNFSVEVRRDYSDLDVAIKTEIRSTTVGFRISHPRLDEPTEEYDAEATKRLEDKFVADSIDQLISAMADAAAHLEMLFKTTDVLDIGSPSPSMFTAAAKFSGPATMRVGRDSLKEVVAAIADEVQAAKARGDVALAAHEASNEKWKKFAADHYNRQAQANKKAKMDETE